MIWLQLNQDLTHSQNISLACEGLITVLSVSKCWDGPLVGLVGWVQRGHHAQGSPNPSGDLQVMGLGAERWDRAELLGWICAKVALTHSAVSADRSPTHSV